MKWIQIRRKDMVTWHTGNCKRSIAFRGVQTFNQTFHNTRDRASIQSNLRIQSAFNFIIIIIINKLIHVTTPYVG